MKISVIIPALNEAGGLEGALSSIGGGIEAIVSDGGSTDGTRHIAQRLGAILIDSRPGRGAQMDSGAKRATGDILLFLHADTKLPKGWDKAVKGAFKDDKVVAGAFTLSIGSEGMRFRLIEKVAMLRCRALGLIYGDQAIFARKDSFFKAGGYDNLPLMEDIDCVKRLRRLGRVVILKERATTSARRWAKRGAIRNTVRNALILSLYFFGASPQRLYSLYYNNRIKRL